MPRDAVTREEERGTASREMEELARAGWLAMSVDERIRAWERYFDWARALVGIEPGRPYCAPGHVPAGLAGSRAEDR